MIIIFTEKSDLSTCDVVDWLIYYNKSYLRINEDDLFEIDIEKNQFILCFQEYRINIDEIKAVWYRRSLLQIKQDKFENKGVQKYIFEEKTVLKEYLLFLFSKKKTIGKANGLRVNKLIINHIAKSVGLKTPNSFLSKSKKDLQVEYSLITKTINENPHIKLNNELYFSLLTKEVKKNDKNQQFGISFFQEKIEKRYELRVFYLNEKKYSMAIFSQKNKKTEIDFRDYDKEKPNRVVPYKIPKKIELKIIILMKKINLNCGSIDILVDKNLDYYFLEVNPVGQFGMVSIPCNYYLEEKIANYL